MELTHGQIGRDQVFLLINVGDVGPVGLFANDGNSIGVFGADSFGFGGSFFWMWGLEREECEGFIGSIRKLVTIYAIMRIWDATTVILASHPTMSTRDIKRYDLPRYSYELSSEQHNDSGTCRHEKFEFTTHRADALL